MQFRAVGEGLAWTELRGNPLPTDPERFWRNAFDALLTGFGAPANGRPRQDQPRQRIKASPDR